MRIVVADDHPLVRAGVKTALSRDTALEVVAEAHDAAETLRVVKETQPDLLLLDVEMPGEPCDSLAVSVRQVCPKIKILILSGQVEKAWLRKLTRVAISGYLLKDEAPECLLQAIRTIREGATWFSNTVAQQLLSLHMDPDPTPDLTKREKQILLLIAGGKDNAFIADQLHLAEQTVRNYASTIYNKLGLATRVEAVVWARKYLEMN